MDALILGLAGICSGGDFRGDELEGQRSFSSKKMYWSHTIIKVE